MQPITYMLIDESNINLWILKLNKKKNIYIYNNISRKLKKNAEIQRDAFFTARHQYLFDNFLEAKKCFDMRESPQQYPNLKEDIKNNNTRRICRNNVLQPILQKRLLI